MKTRDYVLVNAQNISDSQTFTKDLKTGLKIQELRVIYQDQNGATSNTLGKLNAMVSKLEVLDGSDVLHSLSFRQEQARDYFLTGRLPFQQLSQAKDAIVIEEADIYFGRFPGDREFYLDTSRFSNAQLALTHALTVSASAGFVSGDGYLTVIAKLIEEGALPCRGFIMSKQADAYTTLGTGYRTTDLPLKNDYQSLMFGALETLIEPDVDISNYKLTRNDDSFVDFNLSATQILQENMRRLPQATQKINILPDTTFSWLGDLYGRLVGRINLAGTTGKAVLTALAGEKLSGTMTTGETAEISAVSRGYCPHSFLEWVFGDGREVDDYFKVAGLSKAELIATDAAAGGAYTVVTNQLRS